MAALSMASSSPPNIWYTLWTGSAIKSKYLHPDGLRLEIWCLCPIRNRHVNLVFECPFVGMEQVVRGMEHAYEHNTYGIKITQTTDSNPRRKFKYAAIAGQPIFYAFNCDFHAVDYEDLSPVDNGRITDNVDIVMFQGTKYIHKFMIQGSHQESFEKETMNYCQLSGCEGVLALKAVVKRGAHIQGLMIPYIEGDNLWEASIEREDELCRVTFRIIEIAASLEKVGYYHQDLKCQNIIQRESSGELFFIDFAGGITDGFYPPESEADLQDGKVDARTGMYILGKTVWQLWSWKHPKIQDELESFDIPEPARSIIYDCISNQVATIEELLQKYYYR